MPGCARPGQGLLLLLPWPGAGPREPFPWAGGTRPCAPNTGVGLGSLGTEGCWVEPSQSLGLTLAPNLGSNQRCWWLPHCGVSDVGMGLFLFLLPGAILSSLGGSKGPGAGPGVAKDPKKPQRIPMPGATRAACPSISRGGSSPVPGAGQRLGGSSPAPGRGTPAGAALGLSLGSCRPGMSRVMGLRKPEPGADRCWQLEAERGQAEESAADPALGLGQQRSGTAQAGPDSSANPHCQGN